MSAQFKEFVKFLENYTGNKNFEKLKCKDIIQVFFSTDLKLYKGVEITVHCICAAAVKLSVESDVESLVSRYEKHLKVDRHDINISVPDLIQMVVITTTFLWETTYIFSRPHSSLLKIMSV